MRSYFFSFHPSRYLKQTPSGPPSSAFSLSDAEVEKGRVVERETERERGVWEKRLDGLFPPLIDPHNLADARGPAGGVDTRRVPTGSCRLHRRRLPPQPGLRSSGPAHSLSVLLKLFDRGLDRVRGCRRSRRGCVRHGRRPWYIVGTVRSLLAILQWWAFNVTVIIINKWIFQKLDFKFPLTVSCIHFICSSIGAFIAIRVLKIKPLIEVEPTDLWRRIFPMSCVFCLNIVLGNVSLRYIPVSFMQTIKSFTPATTVLLQWLVWRKYFDSRIWLSLVPIVGGILLTSVTELSFNIFGFFAALFGCVATSTKTILAESLLHGYNFDSINTVYYMAPFATMILAIPAIVLEGGGVIGWLYTYPSVGPAFIIIISSGLLAFCLNFSIFYVIHSTTAVTFNVAGNLKVAVAVLVSWLIFQNPISIMNAFGCAVTLCGCTFYGYVRNKLSKQQPSTPRTPRTPRSRIELLPLVNDNGKQDK